MSSKIPRLLQSASPWVLGLGVLSAGLMGGYFVTSVQALRGMTTSELSDDLGFSVVSVVYLGSIFLILTFGVGFEIVCRIARARGREGFGDGVSAYWEKMWARDEFFVLMFGLGALIALYMFIIEILNPEFYPGRYRSSSREVRLAIDGFGLIIILSGAVFFWFVNRKSRDEGD